MIRAAFLPAISLLALAPSAGAQVVIGGPADISVDLSALDRVRQRPQQATRVAAPNLTAPAAPPPAAPAPVAPVALAVRPAAVLQPGLPPVEPGTVAAPAQLERASLPGLAAARVPSPRLAAPTFDLPAQLVLTAPPRIEVQALDAAAALRLPVGLVAPAAAALHEPRSLSEAAPPALTARLHLQRASLQAPNVALPATPAALPTSGPVPFTARYVLASPVLARPIASALDAVPRIDGDAAAPRLLRAAVLRAPETGAIEAPVQLAERDAPTLAARNLLAQARLAAPAAGTIAPLPEVQSDAAPRITAALLVAPSAPALHDADLAPVEAAALRALPAIEPRNAPGLDTQVVRASLRAPGIALPGAPAPLPGTDIPHLQARPVLLSPRLDAPAPQAPDALPQLERRSQLQLHTALYAVTGIVAPSPRTPDAPRELAAREAPSLTAAPYLLRVSLRAPQAEPPQAQATIASATPPALVTRVVAPRLAAPPADAVTRTAALQATSVDFAAPVRNASHVVAPDARTIATPAVLTAIEPPALRATARALPAELRAPRADAVDAPQIVAAALAPSLQDVTRDVAPQFEAAVMVRPSTPAPLPPSNMPDFEAVRMQNAVLREPAAARDMPAVTERLAFVAAEPPPPAALGPTPKIPAPRATPPASTTKVPPKPGALEGTAPAPHAATQADPNPVTPQAAPAPNIAAPDGSTKSSLSPGKPEKGERSAVRLQFGTDVTALPDDVETALAPIVASLKRAPKARIVLRGYAAGTGESGGKSKRVALTRATELRNFFIAHGIEATRIDVRALGIPGDDGAADRVDIGLLD